MLSKANIQVTRVLSSQRLGTDAKEDSRICKSSPRCPTSLIEGTVANLIEKEGDLSPFFTFMSTLTPNPLMQIIGIQPMACDWSVRVPVAPMKKWLRLSVLVK